MFDGPVTALTPAVLSDIYGEAARVPHPAPQAQPQKEQPLMELTRRVALLAALAVPLAAPARAQAPEINFGIVSTEGTQNLRSQWEPFLQDMQKSVGVKVNGFYPSDYAGVIEAMRFNKVQVALGTATPAPSRPWTAPRARCSCRRPTPTAARATTAC